MRFILTILITTILGAGAFAQSLDLSGGRGSVRIDNGNVQLVNSRGSRVEIPTPNGGAPNFNVNGSGAVRRDVVVGRSAQGEWTFQDSNTGESAVIDMAPGGTTRVESARGSYTVPTSVVRDFLGNDKDAARFFEALSR